MKQVRAAYGRSAIESQIMILRQNGKFSEIYPGEIAFFLKAAEEAIMPGEPVLELAPALGRMSLEFARHGIPAIALEASEHAIYYAEKVVLGEVFPELKNSVRFVHGDMRYFRVTPGQEFSFIFNAWQSFWFVLGMESAFVSEAKPKIVLTYAESCLTSIIKCLRINGVFIIDRPKPHYLEDRWWDIMAEKLGFLYHIIEPYGQQVSGSPPAPVLVGIKIAEQNIADDPPAEHILVR